MIKRLQAGKYIELLPNKLEEFTYFSLDNAATDMSLEEAVELVDKGFRKAITRCFDKDMEYGFKYHLADMSGGLDSRMISWVARDLGYSNIMNICFAQSESIEEKIAQEVASMLKNEFLFKSLDDAAFVYDIEDIVHKNFGLALYSAMTGTNRLLNILNFDKFGLSHTGQIGDVVIGTFNKFPREVPPDSGLHRYSTKIQYEPPHIVLEKYANHELFAIYTRGIQGAMSSNMVRRNYTETFSPFVDVDFMQTCLSIPLKYRCGHTLYKKWIQTKYPDALKIATTRLINRGKGGKLMSFMLRACRKIWREARQILVVRRKHYEIR